jgi:undecaprenyl-diphosphatase
VFRRAGEPTTSRALARVLGRRSGRSLPTHGSAWTDVVRIGAGATVLAVTWREATAEELPAWEQPAFEAVNQLPEGGRLLWPVMQFGSFAAIPVVSVAIARVTGDRRFAASVGAAGLAAYLGAKVMKKRVGRGRPGDVFEEIVRREDASGFGYPSGHAAEAAAMATVLASRLSLGWQWLPLALVTSVSTGRLFFGAHLPHDVIGGAAMGTMLGGSINLATRFADGIAPVRTRPGAPIHGLATAVAR